MNKVFTFNIKNLTHCIDKQYIITDINLVDDSTILFVKKEDYISIPDSFKKRTIILSDLDIIEINTLAFKQTKFYSKNIILLKSLAKNIQFKKHLLDLKYVEYILENPEYSKTDKFHYILSKGIIKKFKHIGIYSKNARRLSVSNYFFILNLITNNSYTKKRFNKEMQSFFKSNLIQRSNSFSFDLNPNNFFRVKHSVYTQKCLLKGEKYNLDIFFNNAIEFSYSKPLVGSTWNDIHTTTSQETIANYYNVSQSNIAYYVKNKKLLYKFEVISKIEYHKELYLKSIGESTSYVFEIKTFSKQVDLKKNEIYNDTYYVRSSGSRLINRLQFKSLVSTKKNKIFKSDTLFRGKKNKKHNTLISLHKTDNRYKTIQGTIVDFIDSINVREADSLKPKFNEFQSSTDRNHNINTSIQIVSDSYSIVKSKLISILNTVALVKSFKSFNIDVTDKHFLNIDLNINDIIKNILRLQKQVQCGIIKNSLKTSKENILNIKNIIYFNFSRWHKFLIKNNILSNIDNFYSKNFKSLEESFEDMINFKSKEKYNYFIKPYFVNDTAIKEVETYNIKPLTLRATNDNLLPWE